MTQMVYPQPDAQILERCKQLALGIHDAIQEFSRQVFADGALDEKTKQLIAVAVAHVTQCAYCIRGHTRAAPRKGADERELMEAIWVAAEMRAGGAFAHATLALDAAGHATGPHVVGCSPPWTRDRPAHSKIHSQARGTPWHTVCLS